MRSLARVILGVAISAVLLILALGQVTWGDVKVAFSSVRVFPWVPLALLVYLLGHFVRGWRCRLLVSGDAALSTVTATNIVVTGYAVNNILPFRAGELVRSAILSDRTGIPVAQSLTVVFVERVLDGLAMLFLFVLSSRMIKADLSMDVSGWVVGLLLAAALGTVLIAVVSPGLLVGLVSRCTSRLSQPWPERFYSIALSITHGVSNLRRASHAGVICALSLAIWLIEAGMFVFLFKAFALAFDFGRALFTMSVTNLGILIPSSPGHFGTFHFFCSQSLMATGVSREVAVPYSIAAHLSFFLPMTLWGILVLSWYGYEVGSMVAMTRRAETLPSLAEKEVFSSSLCFRTRAAQENSVSGTFLTALIEACLPLEELALPPAGKRSVVNKVSAFVDGQLASFNAPLRVLLAIGLAGFRFIVWATCHSGFLSLSPENQRKLLARWAFGKIGPVRQMLRPIHSLALLAFYETEEVRSLMEPDSGED
jgi:glycosyltransferase 2 family protein